MRDLARFLRAQDAGSPSQFEVAISELRAGCKQSHWIWFVLPQLRGLGLSDTANFYGIADMDEARSYLEHQTLGCRLEDTLTVMNTSLQERSIPLSSLMGGELDGLKALSSITLFEAAGLRQATRLLNTVGSRCTRTREMLEEADKHS